MADLTTMQSQLEQLRKADRSGVRSTQYEGKSVTYGSAAEMRRAIRDLETEIASAGLRRVTTAVIHTSKNW